jgi:hypothetical protein
MMWLNVRDLIVVNLTISLEKDTIQSVLVKLSDAFAGFQVICYCSKRGLLTYRCCLLVPGA